ncbi:MAG: hypothetical protein COA78_07985 [Blastopirellula sp.]|nr:MAG: hypothetical protein COA78_07985 [Blastopirellula sp.]
MIHTRQGSSTLFVVSQIVFVVLGASLFVASSQPSISQTEIPELRNQPLDIKLQYDVPQVVTDEQLLSVMYKLRPQFTHAQPKINFVDHALRCWGTKAQFNLDDCLSGEQMLGMLTDHKQFTAAWGEETAPLLYYKKHGLDVRMASGAATASHVDHTLSTLAEIGVPLDYTLTTSQGSAKVEDLLVQSMRSFLVNQKEYEWTTVAAALYATGSTSWTSSEGERVTFDVLAKRIMRQPWAQGVCYGNHRLYSLALLLQIDDQITLFEDRATRSEVIAYLVEATSRLIASQSEAGYWDQNWYDGSRTPEESTYSGPQGRRILATGHALEWWAIAPKEVQPPREVVIRAGQWLVSEISNMEPESLNKSYTFLTHVGRALCLWRGKFPHEIAGIIKSGN